MLCLGEVMSKKLVLGKVGEFVIGRYVCVSQSPQLQSVTGAGVMSKEQMAINA